jgi:hypothetical protein
MSSKSNLAVIRPFKIKFLAHNLFFVLKSFIFDYLLIKIVSNIYSPQVFV